MPPPVGNKRKRRRERVRLYAGLKSKFDQSRGELVDMSQNGLRLVLQRGMLLKRGEPVEIYIQKIGVLSGKVSWKYFKVVGIELDNNTNTYAQTLAALRKYKQKLA